MIVGSSYPMGCSAYVDIEGWGFTHPLNQSLFGLKVVVTVTHFFFQTLPNIWVFTCSWQIFLKTEGLKLRLWSKIGYLNSVWVIEWGRPSVVTWAVQLSLNMIWKTSKHWGLHFYQQFQMYDLERSMFCCSEVFSQCTLGNRASSYLGNGITLSRW